MGDMTERWIHTGYAQRLQLGPGEVGALGEVVRELGLRHLLLVTSAGRYESPEVQRLVEQLGRFLAEPFAAALPHVPTSVVQHALRQARRDAVDGIVSFGGGSCIDLGKALAFFAEREAGAPGASFADRPMLPHIAIPTTFAGAETTPFFTMLDERSGTITGGGGPTIAPMVVLHDPELTRSVPCDVAATTAMAALAHAVEAAWAEEVSPEAEAVALAALTLLATSLPQVVDDPVDDDPRARLATAAALAGRARQNASMGAQHGLAQLVCGRRRIPYGLAHAFLLPPVLRFNADVAPAAAARIGQALGQPDDPARAVEQLRLRVGITGGLARAGVTEDDLDAIARAAPRHPDVQANPRPLGELDARALLEAAW